MMKLSHESKVRLGVGIGAFVLIIGLAFGISRLLAHSDMVRTTGILSGALSDFDDMFDDDDLLDSGNYSARPQQLSSTTFDADEFRYLDFDINAASVDVKVVDGNKAHHPASPVSQQQVQWIDANSDFRNLCHKDTRSVIDCTVLDAEGQVRADFNPVNMEFSVDILSRCFLHHGPHRGKHPWHENLECPYIECRYDKEKERQAFFPFWPHDPPFWNGIPFPLGKSGEKGAGCSVFP